MGTKNMEQKLIVNISPTVSLFADELQYIVVFKANPTQLIRNGHHTYHRTLGDAFEDILSYQVKLNLADDRDKSMKEIANIIESTIQEIKALFKPFEEIFTAKID